MANEWVDFKLFLPPEGVIILVKTKISGRVFPAILSDDLFDSNIYEAWTVPELLA